MTSQFLHDVFPSSVAKRILSQDDNSLVAFFETIAYYPRFDLWLTLSKSVKIRVMAPGMFRIFFKWARPVLYYTIALTVFSFFLYSG